MITEIGGKTGLDEADGRAIAEMVIAKVPMHRFAAAEELAAAALFLASADSAFITGQQVITDGGWTGVG